MTDRPVARSAAALLGHSPDSVEPTTTAAGLQQPQKLPGVSILGTVEHAHSASVAVGSLLPGGSHAEMLNPARAAELMVDSP